MACVMCDGEESKLCSFGVGLGDADVDVCVSGRLTFALIRAAVVVARVGVEVLLWDPGKGENGREGFEVGFRNGTEAVDDVFGFVNVSVECRSVLSF